MIIDLIGQSYESPSRSNSPQRTINWYLIDNEDKQAKSKYVMVPTAGSTSKLTLIPTNGSGCRGLYYSSSGPAPDFESRLYCVFGTTAYRINSDMTYKKLGEINNATTAVSMIDNGFYCFIADGTSLWRSRLLDDDATAALEACPLPYLPGTTDVISPVSVVFTGQRIVVNAGNSNQFFYSDLASNTFQADSFYSAEQSSDTIKCIANVSGNLWVFGPRSYEIWRGTDVFDDPIAFVGGSATAIGCRAPYSVGQIGDTVYWLGSSDVGDNAVFMGAGLTAKRVSTQPIEYAISKLSNKDKAIGYCYQSTGNIFYVLTFVQDRRTFAYEATTGLWAERNYIDPATNEEYAYRPAYASRAFGETFFGTLTDSQLCILDDDKYVEYDGAPIIRQRISPVYFQDLDMWLLQQLTIDMEVGTTTLLSGQGSDPKMIVSVSYDGGMTFGDWMLISVGQQGAYREPVTLKGLGIGRNIVVKLQYSEPTPCSVYQGAIYANKCHRGS